jgi:hypothetical protein
MANSNETFNFTYSAKQQEEVRKIRQKYEPQKENKLEMLRRLDRSVLKRGTVVSLTVGVISSLVLGVGMTFTMVWTDFFFIGVIVGLTGIVGMLLAYPIFISVTKKQREKLKPQIFALSDELVQCSS